MDLKTIGLMFAREMAKEELFQINLKGKVCLVTGSTIGSIGFETAQKLYQMGANVVLGVRSDKNGQEAKEKLEQEASCGKVKYMLMDLSDLDSVHKMVRQFKQNYSQLDLLFNTAGIMNAPHAVNKKNIEIQFATNHMGHFLLTMSLLDLIQKVNGRIINVSSIGFRIALKDEKDVRKYATFTVENVTGDGSNAKTTTLYGRSKLANVLFARKLAREYPNIFSCSVHPGMVATQIGRHYGASVKLFSLPLKLISKTPWQGAQTSLHCGLTSITDLTNGGYYEECEIGVSPSYVEDIELQDKLWETSLYLAREYLE